MQLTRKTERGSTLDTKSYRKLSNVSYSDIKMWLTDRKRFYRTKILGDTITEKTSDAKTIGDLIHCKVLEPQNWDKLFCVAPANVPGQMGELAYAMYERSVQYLNENNEITVHISVIIEEALNQVKYNGKGEVVKFSGKELPKVIEMFSDSPAETLYNCLRLNHGKTVVSPYQDEKATKIVEALQQSPYVGHWVNAKTSAGVDVHNEIPIVFQHLGVEVKSLIDRMIVDHTARKVYVLDVKSSWDTERFERNYLNLCYYIQACLYQKAVEAWCEQQDVDYYIEPMKYIVADSQGYMQPVLYECTGKDIQAAYEGFKVRGYEYTGLKTALQDIKYGIETGMWNIDRKVANNMGKCSLDIQYDNI